MHSLRVKSTMKLARSSSDFLPFRPLWLGFMSAEINVSHGVTLCLQGKRSFLESLFSMLNRIMQDSVADPALIVPASEVPPLLQIKSINELFYRGPSTAWLPPPALLPALLGKRWRQGTQIFSKWLCPVPTCCTHL